MSTPSLNYVPPSSSSSSSSCAAHEEHDNNNNNKSHEEIQPTQEPPTSSDEEELTSLLAATRLLDPEEDINRPAAGEKGGSFLWAFHQDASSHSSVVSWEQEMGRIMPSSWTCLGSLGTFTWCPPPTPARVDASSSSLGSSSGSDWVKGMKQGLRLAQPPPTLRSVQDLNLPRVMKPLKRAPKKPAASSRYQVDWISLHVARERCHHPGQEAFSGHHTAVPPPWASIQVSLGGSALNFLATRDTQTSYLVSRVPHHPPASDHSDDSASRSYLLLVVKEKTRHHSDDVGPCFERLMTEPGSHTEGQASSYYHTCEHLHVLQIGAYRVLFRAEVDACLWSTPSDSNEGGDGGDGGDGDAPSRCLVEIKTKQPRYWKTQVLFQMISSGSALLCHGTVAQNMQKNLRQVRLWSLSEVALQALQHRNREQLEQQIYLGLQELLHTGPWHDPSAARVYRVSFVPTPGGGSKTMRWEPLSGEGVLCPPVPVMQELLFGAS